MARQRVLPTGISLRGPLRTKSGRTPARYRVRVTWEGRQYDIGQYSTLDIARAAQQQAQAEIVKGTFVPPAERRRRRKAAAMEDAARELTLNEWVPQWLEALASADPPRSPGTITSYRSTLNAHVLGSLGSKRLVDITEDDVNAVVNSARLSGMSASRNVGRALRTCFNAALTAGKGGLTESPVKLKISSRSRKRGDDEVPTAEEVRALAAAIPPEMRLAVWIAALCQLRAGEVLGLQRRDFWNLGSPDLAELHVNRQWLSKANPPAYGSCKDDSARVVAIPSALVPMIVEHMDNYVNNDAEAPVIPSPRDKSRPRSHNSLANAWTTARAEVHPGLAFHSLRHFGLTSYAQQGATATEVQRRGGHRDPEAAARYQHSSTVRDRQLAEALNNVLGE